jgi:hypothetical protein
MTHYGAFYHTALYPVLHRVTRRAYVVTGSICGYDCKPENLVVGQDRMPVNFRAVCHRQRAD